jgi:hypothetical protein
MSRACLELKRTFERQTCGSAAGVANTRAQSGTIHVDSLSCFKSVLFTLRFRRSLLYRSILCSIAVIHLVSHSCLIFTFILFLSSSSTHSHLEIFSVNLVPDHRLQRHSLLHLPQALERATFAMVPLSSMLRNNAFTFDPIGTDITSRLD